MSESRKPLFSRAAIIVAVTGIAALLWLLDPGAPPGPKPPDPNVNGRGTRGASEFWFGIRADNGPLDPVTGRPKGVLVKSVLPGSPADSAGLTGGDLILEFAEARTEVPKQLAQVMDTLGAGKPARAKVLRGEQLVYVDITLEDGGTLRLYQALASKGAAFLATRQRDDGAYPHFHLVERGSPAVTALAAWALAVTLPELGEDAPPEATRALDAALAALEASLTGDGALDTSGWDIGHRSYGSACALLAFAARDAERYAPRIAALQRFLLSTQVSEATGYDPMDWRYGGFPYYESLESAELRTDVSTLSYVVQALSASKLPAQHPAWRRIGLWLDEAQNFALISEAEASQAIERPYRDGGFAFSARNSKALSPPTTTGELAIFPSYGSATADGLRSLVRVDGSASHPRAIAALRWLARNYDLERNPGLEDEGPTPWGRAIYFYYLHSLARALHDARVARLIVSPDGEGSSELVHHWPAELIRELGRQQREAGEWLNPQPLMGEDHPVVATAFALLALHAARRTLDLEEVVTVRAMPRRAPPKWDDQPLTALPQDPVERGLIAFRQQRCASCHKDGFRTNGPSLVGVADRFLQAHGSAAGARSYMKKHIRRPDLYPGTERFEGLEMTRYTESMLPGPQLEDLTTFLLSRTGDAPVSKALLSSEANPPLDSDVGAMLFQRLNCNSCHDPQAGHAPTLLGVGDRYLRAKGTPEKARAALAAYLRQPADFASLAPPRGNGAKMTPYDERSLSDAELDDLVAYLMLLK